MMEPFRGLAWILLLIYQAHSQSYTRCDEKVPDAPGCSEFIDSCEVSARQSFCLRQCGLCVSCFDDTVVELCELWQKNCTTNKDVSSTCPKTCGFCTDDMVTVEPYIDWEKAVRVNVVNGMDLEIKLRMLGDVRYTVIFRTREAVELFLTKWNMSTNVVIIDTEEQLTVETEEAVTVLTLQAYNIKPDVEFASRSFNVKTRRSMKADLYDHLLKDTNLTQYFEEVEDNYQGLINEDTRKYEARIYSEPANRAVIKSDNASLTIALAVLIPLSLILIVITIALYHHARTNGYWPYMRKMKDSGDQLRQPN